MVEILCLKATVGAAAVEQPIGSLICPEREKIVILETFYFIAGAGEVKGYFKQRQIDLVDHEAQPTAAERVVKNIEMVAGDEYSFKGTDTSGAPNIMIAGLVIDRTTVA
jgi:hypothetical protein